jgi:Na+/H+-dicarboxylate symporter
MDPEGIDPRKAHRTLSKLPAHPRILWGHLTALSLGALGLALAMGIFGYAADAAWISWLAAALKPIGSVWISALRMTVIPLVLAQLLVALTGTSHASSLGRLGLRTFGLFLAFIMTAGIVTILAMDPVVRTYSVDPTSAATLRAETVIPEAAVEVTEGAPVSLGDWIQNLVPSNVFSAATDGEILPLLVFTLLFGLAVASVGGEARAHLGALFSSLAEAMMQVVFWVLWVTPVAVFVLVLELSLTSGTEALGLLLFYVVVVCGWMLFVTGFLYPVSAFFGRISLVRFAKAVAPAQMVAVSTRSSLASLPALIEGGKEHLEFGPATTCFVLPLSTAVFKMSTMTAEPVRYLFLAHLFGIPLTLPQTATFLATLAILSFSGVGVPRGGSGFDTLPAYMAAGIPVEGLVLVVAVDTLPDIMKTIINVTGHMSVATLASLGLPSGPADPGGKGPGGG